MNRDFCRFVIFTLRVLGGFHFSLCHLCQLDDLWLWPFRGSCWRISGHIGRRSSFRPSGTVRWAWLTPAPRTTGSTSTPMCVCWRIASTSTSWYRYNLRWLVHEVKSNRDMRVSELRVDRPHLSSATTLFKIMLTSPWHPFVILALLFWNLTQPIWDAVTTKPKRPHWQWRLLKCGRLIFSNKREHPLIRSLCFWQPFPDCC